MKYRKGYKYQLAEDEVFETKIRPNEHISTHFIELTVGGEMTVRTDYAWDGASGPTIDTKSAMRGPLFHDAVYQFIRMELLDPKWRIPGDEELGRFLIEDGMWRWRARLWVRELRKFGGFSADPKNSKEVLVAP